MKYIISTILAIAILYAWAGLIFAFLCLRFDRREEKQRNFLERYFRDFTQRSTKPSYPEATPKVIRDKGSRGWGMIGLPIILLSFGDTFPNVTLSVSILFFGGLLFAQSWYALRCHRGLRLDSSATSRPDKSANDQPDPTS